MCQSYRTNPETGYTIGRYVSEERARSGKSRNQVCEVIGISQYKLARIEHNESFADPDLLWKIVQVLNMRVREAFHCARLPAARHLPERLLEHASRISANDRVIVEQYLSLLRGDDPTDHPQASL